VASAVIIVMATAVLGSVFNSFAATLEIPTWCILMGTNIQENSFKFVEDDSMDFCILFNSANRHWHFL
jgi:hypothetical protein